MNSRLAHLLLVLLVAVAGSCGPAPLVVTQPKGLEFRVVMGPGDPGAVELPRRNAPAGGESSLYVGPAEGFEVAKIFSSYDAVHYPAVGFEIAEADAGRFEAWTASLAGSQLAIVVNGEVVTAPEINEPLPGAGIITGGVFGFSEEEVRDLIQAMDP